MGGGGGVVGGGASFRDGLLHKMGFFMRFFGIDSDVFGRQVYVRFYLQNS